MSSNVVAAAKSIDTGRASQFYLPNCCTSRAVLVTILIVELTALVITLGRSSSGIDFWTDLARTSFFLLWVGLAGAGTLCALRSYLNAQTVSRGSGFVLALSGTLVAIISIVALWVGSLDMGGYTGLNGDQSATPWSFVARNVVIAIIVTALALRYFYVTHEWRHNVELQAQARVHALQARIRPHFLFNSMNTIAALTRTSPARAESAVQDLADLFRATLSEKRNTIALSEEIEVARTYQRMEALRLGNRLVVEWQIEALPLSAVVPGLVLQPLLENAIYHGIEPRPGGGKIHVLGEFAKGMITLVVRNPLPADNLTIREGNRLALANIRERLELMYDERATVKSGRFDDEYIVTLRFPFREAQPGKQR
ncbi:MAG: histidine kinase [Steroidobacteraceae bacterium]